MIHRSKQSALRKGDEGRLGGARGIFRGSEGVKGGVYGVPEDQRGSLWGPRGQGCQAGPRGSGGRVEDPLGSTRSFDGASDDVYGVYAYIYK